MEQQSNVQVRAEKEYKNSRDKFQFLLREIISNSLHAVIIRENKEENFIPKIKLTISINENECKIVLRDNGEGFTEMNRSCFQSLDKINQEKKKYNFHPLGQGRLALVYFADSALYESVYKGEDGEFMKRNIPYPDSSERLFDVEKYNAEEICCEDSYTELSILITSVKLRRARTFFNRMESIEQLKTWFIEIFFPFIIQNNNLIIEIEYNGEIITINKESLTNEFETQDFTINLQDENEADFTLWLLKSEVPMKGENLITCFARNLKAELTNGKLVYPLDNEEGYKLYLSSNYFDEYVDTKGEKIEISSDDIKKINDKINGILNVKFEKTLKINERISTHNFKNFKNKYPSLEIFFPKEKEGSNNIILSESEILKTTIEEKSRIEKKFWNSIDKELTDEESYNNSDECHKLLNSSLQIYVKHREIVLKQLKRLIQLFDENGEEKPELEKTVHELFIRRGVTLDNPVDINHLHNLWILDDKFTIFSNEFQAKSTVNGQALTDIYIWADAPQKTKQILLLELKSPTKAHNAGNKKEGMITQIKRYAREFYNNPNKSINWSINPSNLQYIGIVIARSSDIRKEITSNHSAGGYNKIPFLDNSYYCNDCFYYNDNPDNKVDIRIELYSFEDIYELASSRNEVFFKLLKKEFEFYADDEMNKLNLL